MTTEYAETIAALELVTFRRLGQNRVHAALVMPATLRPGTILGHPVTMIDGPVRGFCDRTLRGRKMVITDDSLDSWRRNGHVCPECIGIARLALARVEAST